MHNSRDKVSKLIASLQAIIRANYTRNKASFPLGSSYSELLMQSEKLNFSLIGSLSQLALLKSFYMRAPDFHNILLGVLSILQWCLP